MKTKLILATLAMLATAQVNAEYRTTNITPQFGGGYNYYSTNGSYGNITPQPFNNGYSINQYIPGNQNNGYRSTYRTTTCTKGFGGTINCSSY